MPMDRSRLWEQQFSPVSVQRVRSDETPAAECRLLNEFRDSGRPRCPRDGGTFAGQEPSAPGLHAERSITPHRPPPRQREGRPCPESHPFVGGVVAVVVQPVIDDGRGRNGVPDHQVGVGADRDRSLARVKSVQLGEHSSSSEIGTETLVVPSSCRNVRIISSNMAMPSLLRAARVALLATSTVPRGRVPEACRQAPSRGRRCRILVSHRPWQFAARSRRSRGAVPAGRSTEGVVGIRRHIRPLSGGRCHRQCRLTRPRVNGARRPGQPVTDRMSADSCTNRAGSRLSCP